LKMEGPSDVATSGDKKFRYHIGGFGGFSTPMFNNIKQISLTAPGTSVAEVRKGKAEAPHIHIMADASKVMNGPVNISISKNTTVMVSPFSVNIANNYVSMFSIDHIHND
jgi:radical SAM superfamily enzyme with C-terminal helix-hairpin-helix motif